MENNSSFKFKLVDVKPYIKGDKKMARVVCYCSYGFIVTLFTTDEKANKLKDKAKDKNYDISSYISVFYDNNKQKFAYVINNNI